jgi:hypothetical protein
MLTDCLLVGDSIALGIAGAFALTGFHGCGPVARTGAATQEIRALVPSRRYDLAIISAGSNDGDNPALAGDLKQLRETVHARRVVWIYPRSGRPAWAVYKIARSYGDGAIGLKHLRSRDDIHPRDYRAAARLIAARAWMRP